MSLRQGDEARFQVATCVRRTGRVPERLGGNRLNRRESIFDSVIKLVNEQRATLLGSFTLVYILGDTYSVKEFPGAATNRRARHGRPHGSSVFPKYPLLDRVCRQVPAS